MQDWPVGNPLSEGPRRPGARRLAASLDTVQREVEDLIAPEWPGRGAGGVLGTERPVQDERHRRLGDAAVRPEAMAPEAGQIVVPFRRAEAGVGPTDDRDIALAVEREREPRRGRGSVQHGLDARNGSGDLDDVGGVQVPLAVDADEAAERAVVGDEPVGDRTDDHAGTLPEVPVEDV